MVMPAYGQLAEAVTPSPNCSGPSRPTGGEGGKGGMGGCRLANPAGAAQGRGGGGGGGAVAEHELGVCMKSIALRACEASHAWCCCTLSSGLVSAAAHKVALRVNGNTQPGMVANQGAHLP